MKKRIHPFSVRVGEALIGISPENAARIVMKYNFEAFAKLVALAAKQGLQEHALEMDKHFSLSIRENG